MRPPTVRRNSLGHVICDRPDGKNSQPSIVWGRLPNGARLFIDQAERGGSQGLLCDCGSLLVAKKGEVNAWHFAHRANELTHCETAFAHALGTLAAQVIQLHGVFLGSDDRTRDNFRWQPSDISFEPIKGGVILRTARSGQKLDIYVTRRRADQPRSVDVDKARKVSALAIVLAEAQFARDDEIALGLVSACERYWLFNRRHAQPRGGAQDLPSLVEEMFPAEMERRRLSQKGSSGPTRRKC